MVKLSERKIIYTLRVFTVLEFDTMETHFTYFSSSSSDVEWRQNSKSLQENAENSLFCDTYQFQFFEMMRVVKLKITRSCSDTQSKYN